MRTHLITKVGKKPLAPSPSSPPEAFLEDPTRLVVVERVGGVPAPKDTPRELSHMKAFARRPAIAERANVRADLSA